MAPCRSPWYESHGIGRTALEPSSRCLRSRKCSLLQTTQKATQNPTHALLAGLRTVKTASPSKDQAAERLASLCGFVLALAAAFKNGQSSPSRIRHNRRILRGKTGFCKQVTQKTTHSAIRMNPQDVARGSLEVETKPAVDPLEEAGRLRWWPVCGPVVACIYG